MKKKLIVLFLASASLGAFAQTAKPYVSQVWNPDNGNGTYTNPVINADYSDPDVVAVGDDYYLTASSFNCIPGLPILHSKDLVNWELIGHAVTKLQPESEFDKPSHGNGVWAPCISYHNGEFYIYWGDPDYGVFMVKTKNPAGKWDDPVCVIPGKGMIDTSPLWDEDGRVYLVNGWANSRNRFASVITVRELNAEGTKAISDPVIVFDGNGTENRTCELGNSCRKRRCADSHAKTCDKKEVQHNIDARGYDQINQRMAAVSYGLQDTDKNVIHYKAERTGKVGSEICNRLRQNIGRCSHQHQDFRCQIHTDRSQGKSCRKTKSHGRVNHLLQIFPVFRSVVPRDDDTGTHRDTIDEADHQKNQIARRADCRQRVAAKKVSHDQGICRVVQLLKQISEKQRDGKQDDLPGNTAFCHSCFALCAHDTKPPFVFYFPLLS